MFLTGHEWDDLAKLVGESGLEYQIPELIESRRENIQVSDIAPVIYTKRLRKVVDHPLVRRLASVTQLGLVSLVYPGAIHSRLEHSLGTLGVATKYISSLFHDTLDPLFRQLVDVGSMKATLLASLFHDIGQYPLAHDLEDVSTSFFGHVAFGHELLSSTDGAGNQPGLFDNDGPDLASLLRDLAKILEEDWGVKLDQVMRIWEARSSEDKKQRQHGSHIDLFFWYVDKYGKISASDFRRKTAYGTQENSTYF